MTPVGPTLQNHWDWRAAGNFSAGGSGSGLLLFIALAGIWQAPPAAGTPIGLLLVATGLGLVWFELGRPWRCLHVFFHPQTSWMTREAGLSIPLLATAMVNVWIGSTLLAWLTGALAVAFVYCQGRILRAARGIPAWRARSIVFLIVSTGLAEGAAICALLLIQTGTSAWLGTAAGLVTLARGLAWRTYRRELARGAPVATLRALERFHPLMIVVGTALPLILLIAAPWVASTLATGLTTVAALAIIATGWLLKFVLIRRAAYNQGFAIDRTAARGGGQAGPGCRPGWS